MRCQECQHVGLKKEFKHDLTAAASPSGQYPWICPKCGELTYVTNDGEKLLYDEEALFLLKKLRQIVDSGDFDVSKLKEELNTLLEYKGKTFRYGLDISQFVKYAKTKIEEKETGAEHDE